MEQKDYLSEEQVHDIACNLYDFIIQHIQALETNETIEPKEETKLNDEHWQKGIKSNEKRKNGRV